MKRTCFKIPRLGIAAALIFALIGLNPVAMLPRTLRAKTAPLIPAELLLNSDGTVNLDIGVSGTVNLNGWQVQLDPLRGPVFSPLSPQITNEWSALGSNGAGNGSLNSWVNDLAISGSDLFVGGDFTDVNNNGTALDAADYVASYGISEIRRIYLPLALRNSTQ